MAPSSSKLWVLTMDIIETSNGITKIVYEYGEFPNIFKDALYYTTEQMQTTTEEMIEAEKKKRYDAWYTACTTVQEIIPVIDEIIADEGLLNG